MKTWLKILSIVTVVIIVGSLPLFPKEEKTCCLCDSFRYHAPCLIDLETGELLEFDLYLSHLSSVAELVEEQPEMGTLSFVQIGNVSGMKLMDSKTIKIYIPNDRTYKPALCNNCRKLLPFGYTKRYILADLYGMEEKILMPINANKTFSLRCYDITTEKSANKGGISVTVQGTLK